MKLIEFPGRKNGGENTPSDGQKNSASGQNDVTAEMESLSHLLEKVGDWIESEVPKIHEEDLADVDPFRFSSLVSEFSCFNSLKGELNVRRICNAYNAQRLSTSQEVCLEFVLALLSPDCASFDVFDAFSVLEKADRLVILKILREYESGLNQ